MWALAEVVLGLLALVVKDHRQASSPPVVAPRSAAVAPAPTAPSTVVEVTGTTLPPATSPAAAGAVRPSPPEAQAVASPPSTTTTLATAGSVSSPAVSVSCHPDLALEASPDSPYTFLCTHGSTPVSWPTDAIRLFTSGLSPQQTGALQLALAEWQHDARFTVTEVQTAAAANVVMTNEALSNNEDGYTSMHYVCAATCVYDHADVRLASSAELTKTSWVSTILHELGHVAGLNHVARHSEVMYPEIDAQSPVVYGSGDLAGLQELEKVRTAT